MLFTGVLWTFSLVAVTSGFIVDKDDKETDEEFYELSYYYDGKHPYYNPYLKTTRSPYHGKKKAAVEPSSSGEEVKDIQSEMLENESSQSGSTKAKKKKSKHKRESGPGGGGGSMDGEADEGELELSPEDKDHYSALDDEDESSIPAAYRKKPARTHGNPKTAKQPEVVVDKEAIPRLLKNPHSAPKGKPIPQLSQPLPDNRNRLQYRDERNAPRPEEIPKSELIGKRMQLQNPQLFPKPEEIPKQEQLPQPEQQLFAPSDADEELRGIEQFVAKLLEQVERNKEEQHIMDENQPVVEQPIIESENNLKELEIADGGAEQEGTQMMDFEVPNEVGTDERLAVVEEEVPALVENIVPNDGDAAEEAIQDQVPVETNGNGQTLEAGHMLEAVNMQPVLEFQQTDREFGDEAEHFEGNQEFVFSTSPDAAQTPSELEALEAALVRIATGHHRYPLLLIPADDVAQQDQVYEVQPAK